MLKAKLIGILREQSDGMTKTALYKHFAHTYAPAITKQLMRLTKVGVISRESKITQHGHQALWLKLLKDPATSEPQSQAQPEDGQPSLFQAQPVSVPVPVTFPEIQKSKYECQHCHKLFKGQRWLSRHLNTAHKGLSATPLPTSSLTITPEPHIAAGKAQNGNEHELSFTKEQLDKLIADQCSIFHTAGYLEATIHRFAFERNETAREYTQRVASVLHANSHR